MEFQKKIISIPSSLKHNHRCSLACFNKWSSLAQTMVGGSVLGLADNVVQKSQVIIQVGGFCKLMMIMYTSLNKVTYC